MGWEHQLQIIGEVALAMLLGGLIGFEREVADKAAGLRTHMLVGGAAALLVGLSDALLNTYSSNTNVSLIRSDPIRIIEAIITGISFLGAGTIFRRDKGDQVKGLTTAASILFTAAVGICIALRQFVLALGATLLTLLILRVMVLIENRITAHRDQDKT